MAALVLGSACWISSLARGEDVSSRDLRLDVLLDGQSIGLIGAFRQNTRGEISARRDELEELGIKVPEAVTRDRDVALLAIPGVTFRYDEAAQRIDIRLPPDGRLPKIYDAQPASGTPLPKPDRSATGAVLNYTLFGNSEDRQFRSFWRYPTLSATLDGRVFSPIGVFSQTGILSDQTLVGGSTEALRLETSWTYSDPDTLLTYRAGDMISSGLAWTRPIRLGGAQFQRNFGLRPDLITLPLPSVTGSAAVPSTVDVFVNGTKAISQDVGSGPFRITNIPILTGNGNASVVVRDASGRQSESSLPFVVSSNLLRPGLFDFSAEVGVPRLQYGLRSSIYGDEIAGSTSARYGITDSFTAIAHAEATHGLGMGSLGGVFGLGQYGVLTAAGSGSWNDGRTGGQSYLSFETQLWGLSFLAASQRSFGAYRDLASATGVPLANLSSGISAYVATPGSSALYGDKWDRLLLPPRALDRVSIAMPVPALGGAISVGFAHVKPVVGPANRIINASYTRPLFGGGSFYATFFTDLADQKSAGVFAGLSFPFGTAITTSTGASRSGSAWSLAADINKPLQQEAGSFGWRIRDVEGPADQKRRSASFAYRGSSGQIEAGVAQSDSAAAATVQLDGSVAIAGGGIFIGNRIDDAFAVAKVGVPDVDVLFENRVVARTDASGSALIPTLRSYQANKISIDARGLPVDALAETTVEVRAPADRAGVVVDFGVRSASSAAIVILQDAAGRPLKVGSTGALQPGLRGTGAAAPEFTIGYDGRAFIENLAADNEIVVQSETGGCRARFPFTPRENTQVTIGPVRCQ
ncbi:fimbria/pilus outer membrane usher protein [Bosea sp. F3-2]|uniref:fimbria/pilus outer membrane usher protein n=1 Tax=Bosea sp. F3-2 TaxID=2599640 RepID=UPI0016553EB3|nr:fimbria/pilus outer membrane usher protein [Bosea sp. F3-2]